MLTSDKRQELIQAALAARQMAYAPYSNYTVGAALLAASGQVYSGANVENAAYPMVMCAERVAIYKAVSEGQRDFLAMAVATVNGGTPCGACRQVMAEFSPEMQVLVVDGSGKLVMQAKVSDLLPGAFGPDKLVK